MPHSDATQSRKVAPARHINLSSFSTPDVGITVVLRCSQKFFPTATVAGRRFVTRVKLFASVLNVTCEPQAPGPAHLDSSDFSTLIGRLEREADSRPQLYVAKVAGAAALGYVGPTPVSDEILAVCLFIIQSLASGGSPSDMDDAGRHRGHRDADRNDTCAQRPDC